MKKFGLFSCTLFVISCAVFLVGCGPKLKDQQTLTINEVTGRKYGTPSFTLTTTGGNGLGLTTWIQTSGDDVAAVASNTGVVLIKGVGEFTVIANKAADGEYKEATSQPYTITIGKGAALIPTPSPITYSQSTLLSSVVLPTGWTWDDELITPTPSVNSYKASFAGSALYDSADSIDISLVVHRLNQTTALVVDEVSTKTLGIDEGFQLAATGGNGTGAVTFQRMGGTATAEITNDGFVTFTTAGTIIVRAIRASDEFYNAAASEHRTIYIKTTLARPENLDMEEGSTVLTWDAVEGATNYIVKIRYSGGVTTDNSLTNSLDISFRLDECGVYKITVIALGDNQLTHIASAESQEYEYIKNDSIQPNS